MISDGVAARPMGGSSDDGDEAGTHESWQPLCQHCTRWRQPDDLTSPRLTVTFHETTENIPVDLIKTEESKFMKDMN